MRQSWFTQGLKPHALWPPKWEDLARTGQEVVANQHAEEHEVVDDTLQVEFKGQGAGRGPELQLQVIAHQPDLEQDEVLSPRVF